MRLRASVIVLLDIAFNQTRRWWALVCRRLSCAGGRAARANSLR